MCRYIDGSATNGLALFVPFVVYVNRFFKLLDRNHRLVARRNSKSTYVISSFVY